MVRQIFLGPQFQNLIFKSCFWAMLGLRKALQYQNTVNK